MKKLAINLALILTSLVGIMFLLYPHVSFWLEKKNQAVIVQTYEKEINTLTPQAKQKALSDAAHYNELLTGEAIEDPFIPGSGVVLPENYTSLLNFHEMIGSVKIPKIAVDIPIYHGTADATLEKGTGHLEGTSLPVGGESTHTVITGHTGLKSAKMFTDLIEMEQGDEFYLYILDDILAYKIDQIKVVEPNETDDLHILKGEDFATLITCTPYGVNNKRLLVRGKRVPYTPQEVEEQIKNTKPVLSRETLLLVVSVSALVFFAGFVTIITIRGQRKYRKNNALKNKTKKREGTAP